MQAIISIWIWLSSISLTVILYFIVLMLTGACYFFNQDRRITHAQCFWWANCVLVLNPYWGLQVRGLENIDRKRAYVVIVNHQSLADIVVLYTLRMQFKWVAKESLFKIPFIGWCLGLIKHIKLMRGDYSSIKHVYHEAAGWLRRGMSVLFFPEGTRTETGQINDFQNGAFKLAIKEKKPILPICIDGTYEAIPKGSWIFKSKVSVKLTVLPAIETGNFNSGDFSKLRDIVKEQISATLL